MVRTTLWRSVRIARLDMEASLISRFNRWETIAIDFIEPLPISGTLSSATYSQGELANGCVQMEHFSIVKIGDEFIIRVGQQGILKCDRKRHAIKLIAYARKLLESPVVPKQMHQLPAKDEIRSE